MVQKNDPAERMMKDMPEPDDPGKGIPEAVMAAAFSRRVSHVRERLDACLRTGLIPDDLLQEMKCLKQEQKNLLTEALPRYRRLHLNDPDRSLNVTVTPVTGSLEPGKLAEADLTEGERTLCRRLAETEAGDEEPDIPDTTVCMDMKGSQAEQEGDCPDRIADAGNADTGNVDTRDGCTDRKGGNPDVFNPEQYEETFWLCVRNKQTAFLFGDGGSVLLFERNCGRWQCRREPVLTGCFVQNAVMESDHSCLVENLDGGVERISYSRMETAEQLAAVSLYEVGDE